MARLERVASVETPASAPRYELRLRRRGPADTEYAIWQLPAAATPHVVAPTRVAGLAGRNLQRTFPNAQFIVSTHSPQVLTTVEPEHIVELAREDGRIVAGSAAGWTYGAEAGDVLSVVMGVDERPANDFTKKLARYRRLVGDDQGESEEALALRRDLQQLSPDDPALGRADVEIRRRKLLREMGESNGCLGKPHRRGSDPGHEARRDTATGDRSRPVSAVAPPPPCDVRTRKPRPGTQGL